MWCVTPSARCWWSGTEESGTSLSRPGRSATSLRRSAASPMCARCGGIGSELPPPRAGEGWGEGCLRIGTVENCGGNPQVVRALTRHARDDASHRPGARRPLPQAGEAEQGRAVLVNHIDCPPALRRNAKGVQRGRDTRARLQDIALPDGQNTQAAGQPASPKIFAFTEFRKRRILRALRPNDKGRIAIVTNAGRTAVDVGHIGATVIAGRETVSDAHRTHDRCDRRTAKSCGPGARRLVPSVAVM
jgi:hypothetical protein